MNESLGAVSGEGVPLAAEGADSFTNEEQFNASDFNFPIDQLNNLNGDNDFQSDGGGLNLDALEFHCMMNYSIQQETIQRAEFLKNSSLTFMRSPITASDYQAATMRLVQETEFCGTTLLITGILSMFL